MNTIRVKAYQTSSDLISLQDAINDDLKKGIGDVVSVDAFTTGTRSDTLIVIVSYDTSKTDKHNRFKAIVDYYKEDNWFEDSNYYIPPKMVPAGPNRDSIVIIAVVTYH